MPTKAPTISKKLEKSLRALGQRLRDRREELGISAVATAEAAEMSRVTLYRIEKGEPSVAMGAYLSVVSALGLTMEFTDPARKNPKSDTQRELPKKIRLANYKQLKKLAWQLKDTKELTPEEALDLYERNWRHVDVKAMTPQERLLIETLLATFNRGRMLV